MVQKTGRVESFEIVEAEPCKKCGCQYWAVDCDPKEENFWLLCIGKDCVECKDIPAGMQIIKHIL